MKQSPSWKTNRFSASQKIPRILWNPNVHYRIHKCPPTVPILSHLDPVHTSTSSFQKTHLSITLPSTLRYPMWSISLRDPQPKPGVQLKLINSRSTSAAGNQRWTSAQPKLTIFYPLGMNCQVCTLSQRYWCSGFLPTNISQSPRNNRCTSRHSVLQSTQIYGKG
jgi:hypothetical protein